MAKSRIAYSQTERLQLLRAAVEKAFGLSWQNVSTEFRPKASTNLGPHDMIDLTIKGATAEIKADRTQIQSFAAESLHKIWLGNRPLVALHMELPAFKAEAAIGTPPPSPPSA